MHHLMSNKTLFLTVNGYTSLLKSSCQVQLCFEREEMKTKDKINRKKKAFMKCQHVKKTSKI